MEPKATSEPDNHVFISYSHADRRWFNRLLQHLQPLVRDGYISVFSDQSIKIGADWQIEIRAALNAASIAVLIVSADFLASKFIVNEELPRLLAGAEDKGTTIMSVIVAPCLFELMPSLSRFQAANPPSNPLSAMRVSEAEEILASLAREIYRHVNPGA